MERTQNRNLWIGLGILALIALFALPMFGGGMMLGRGGFEGYGGRAFGYGGPGPMFWGIGLLFRLVIFGGLLFFVFSLFRRRSFRLHDHDRDRDELITPDLSPLEILRRRYAAGEITRDQFEEMRRTLEGSAST
jgi:uncharacterized membrane protein